MGLPLLNEDTGATAEDVKKKVLTEDRSFSSGFSNPVEEELKVNFEPHMMYDPETGEEYKAEKPEDHERMAKLGYVHEKPDEED